MAATGGQVRNKSLAFGKVLSRGLYSVIDGLLASNIPNDIAELRIVTGGNGLADIPATAGTYVLLSASDVPLGLALDVSALALYVTGTTAWAGGTAGTVSLSFQGTDGTVIATFTQAALTGSASDANPTTYSISAGGTPASGVTDNMIRTIKATLARNVGLQVVVSNSTSGSPVRLRVNGFFVSA